MQTFKLPRSTGNYIQQVRQLRTLIDNKLSAFCTKKVLDSGLTTKTFSYQFDLTGNRSGGQRKSIQKLRDIIQKAVKKQIPYLEYVDGGDMLKNSSSTGSIQLEMKSPWMTYTVERGNRINQYTRNMPWIKSMTRYVRFLNYKCIRKGIPIHIRERSWNEEVHIDDMSRYENWYNKNLREPIKIRVRVAFVARIHMASYYFGDYVNKAGIEGGFTTYENYERWLDEPEDEETMEMYATKKTLRASYYSAENWHVSTLDSRQPSDDYPGAEKYGVAEKVFLELDSMQRVLKTLSRKASYDVAAFNIGSSEAS